MIKKKLILSLIPQLLYCLNIKIALNIAHLTELRIYFVYTPANTYLSYDNTALNLSHRNTKRSKYIP